METELLFSHIFKQLMDRLILDMDDGEGITGLEAAESILCFRNAN